MLSFRSLSIGKLISVLTTFATVAVATPLWAVDPDIIYWSDGDSLFKSTQETPVGEARAYNLAVARDGSTYSNADGHGVYETSPDGQTQTLLDPDEIVNGVAFDNSRNQLYISATGGIEQMSLSGAVTPFLAGSYGILTVDRHGNVFAESADSSSILEITPAGVATTFAPLPNNATAGIAVDPSGNVFVAGNVFTAGGGDAGDIYKITPDGTTTLFYQSPVYFLWNVAAGNNGNIYTTNIALDSNATPIASPGFTDGFPAHFGLAVQPTPEPGSLVMGVMAFLTFAGIAVRRGSLARPRCVT